MANEQFVIRLGVESGGVAAGVNSAVGQIQRLYGGVRNVVNGFLALQAVHWGASLIKDSIDLGGHLNDMADRSATAVESMQEFEFALSQSGGEMTDLTKGLKDMARAQVDAIKGNMELRAVFMRYGVTLNDLRKTKPQDLFPRLAGAIGKAQASSLVTDDVAQIFGKAGEALIPAFRNGFAEAIQQARDLGLVLSREVTDELDAAGDQLDILNKKFKVLMATLTAHSLKGITQFFRDTIEVLAAGEFGGAVTKSTSGLGATISGMLGKLAANAAMETMNAQDVEQEKNDAERRKKRGQEAPGDARKVGSRRGDENMQPSSDQLARIGGYRGGVGEVNRILPQQLAVQQQMERHLSKIASKADKPSPEVQKMLSTLGSLVNTLTPYDEEGF